MVRAVNTQAQNIRERRNALSTRLMLWIEGRERDTGLPAALGLWTGEDVEDITFADMWSGASVTRTFYGAGEMLGVGAIRWHAGLEVRPVTITLSSVSPAVVTALRVYEPRGARVQILKRSYEPDLGTEAGIEPVWMGFVNGAPIPRPAPGGDASMSLECVSSARLLTIPYPRRKSHAAQGQRAGDKFRRYTATAGQWDVPWGLENSR
ncbi:MAG TPA: hypothetical protein PKA33_01750 [Amaricoccus sp.]|uniref:hypothetical protein n=1 Tax=Amaricoccus sp. TaxID=1872485 RepID=UPI002BBB41AE|nr:hypothetical protein [Amaricoccus sp.]HMR51181.1 hypothetical protein [Amaricoccus sp.]HMT98071.1 hypothetical protein [Amaricoccus sp.]